MDQKQHQLFRNQLLCQREQIVASAGVPADFSALDSGAIAGIQDEGFSGDDLLLLQNIGLALVRLEEGIYEQCARCGERISLEQLLANPTTSLCRACGEARNAESGRPASSWPGLHLSSA